MNQNYPFISPNNRLLTMIPKQILVIAIICLLIMPTLNAQNDISSKIRFTGGARSILNNSEISVKDSVADNTTAKKTNGGYALMDLGFNITPNKQTEILGMFRINNRYGGFWGAGVSFDVRQLWLKGILGNVVRYQLGDINLKQTPFTLYNHNEDRKLSLPAVFGLQQSIADYETFYKNSTWRQQGASIDWGLNFSKAIQELKFNHYALRLNATDFVNTADRVMLGSSLTAMKSESLSIGLHTSYIGDLPGTAVADTLLFKNLVQTATWGWNKKLKTSTFKVNGEFGNSVYTVKNDKASPNLQDYFIHVSAEFIPDNQKWIIKGGYLNVGPDFRSLGAQSKRIDYTKQSGFYNLYRNSQVDRPLTFGDYLSQPSVYRTGISSVLSTINPVMNNIDPYGVATFNRTGLYTNFKYQPSKLISIETDLTALKELRGMGTPVLRNFLGANFKGIWTINQYFHYKNPIKITGGFVYQNTSRSSEKDYEKIDLTTTHYSLGLEIGLAEKLELLAGYTGVQSKGNEQLNQRNNYTETIDFSSVNYNVNQGLLGLGLRLKFSQDAHFTVLYQKNSYNNKLDVFQNYSIQQWMAIYNLTF